MNKTELNSIIELFALISLYDNETDTLLSKGFVKLFLKRQFNEHIQASQIENYDSCIIRYGSTSATKQDYENILLSICSKTGNGLSKNQRLIIFINLLQYFKNKNEFTFSSNQTDHEILPIIQKIAGVFKFSEMEYNTLYGFLNDQLSAIPTRNRLMIISSELNLYFSEIKHFYKKGIDGQLVILHLPATNTLLFRYRGESSLEYNQKTVYSDLTYFFDPGSYISVNTNETIYYNEIFHDFMEIQQNISLVASEIKFQFPNSKVGIAPFSFEAHSGELVGIMGISGSGKSTLLNLLNGTLPLSSGNIYINGISVHSHAKKLDGVIGYVPQDDLIIEELSVFQNLYSGAKLCFGNLTDSEIIEKVNQELKSLEIFEIKDLPAGSPLNKFISGGQRKRLNIALETIRKPSVLFIDEPTSGLSSSDSEKIVGLLKNLANSGKLLFINIHQPSSESFKKLNKLLVLDKGGYPIFYGNPMDAIMYFRNNTEHIDLIEGQCPTCKMVHPDDILELIELKTIDNNGSETNDRKFLPNVWYNKFRQEINRPIIELPAEQSIPEVSFSPPTGWIQFITYLKRNILIKLNDLQFITVSLLITPVLALFLGFFVKSYPVEDGIRMAYSFYDNDNLPSFIFMTVIVPLFIGLSISAQEIFKDRKILKREQFLNLSWISYLNSKIVVLFTLSFIQTISFLLISFHILEIKGMFWDYFLILFSLSCLSNLLGLFLSSTIKSIMAIYLIIPFILIPQLLLSGIIIPFDKINYHISSQRYVPIVADLMPSRWGYEALMVNQFTNNKYEKQFFEIDQMISNVSFCSNYTLPKLMALTNDLKQNKITYYNDWNSGISLLETELRKIESEFQIDLEQYIKQIPKDASNPKELSEIDLLLNRLKINMNQLFSTLNYKRDSLLGCFPESNTINNKYNNAKVEEVVKNSLGLERIILDNKSFIRKYEPIFMVNTSNWGRSHFYASSKKFGWVDVKTLYFNLCIIWIMSFIMYLILSFKLHENISSIFKRKKFNRLL